MENKDMNKKNMEKKGEEKGMDKKETVKKVVRKHKAKKAWNKNGMDFEKMKEDIAEKTNGNLLYDGFKTCSECGREEVSWIFTDEGRRVCSYCEGRRKDKEIEEIYSEINLTQRNEYASTVKKAYLRNKSIISKKSYLDKTLKGWNTFNETNKNFIKNIARQATMKLIEGKPLNVILYSEKSGTGKSHLAFAMLNTINDQSKELNKEKGQLSCLAVSFNELLTRIKQSISDGHNQEGHYLELLNNADVLLIDDLGTGKPSEYETNILFSILESRSEEKATIITTNLDKNKLLKKYDNRIVSRLNANGVFIDFELLDDYRFQLIS